MHCHWQWQTSTSTVAGPAGTSLALPGFSVCKCPGSWPSALQLQAQPKPATRSLTEPEPQAEALPLQVAVSKAMPGPVVLPLQIGRFGGSLHRCCNLKPEFRFFRLLNFENICSTTVVATCLPLTGRFKLAMESPDWQELSESESTATGSASGCGASAVTPSQT